jgi:hypothetical protein
MPKGEVKANTPTMYVKALNLSISRENINAPEQWEKVKGDL